MPSGPPKHTRLTGSTPSSEQDGIDGLDKVSYEFCKNQELSRILVWAIARAREPPLCGPLRGQAARAIIDHSPADARAAPVRAWPVWQRSAYTSHNRITCLQLLSNVMAFNSQTMFVNSLPVSLLDHYRVDRFRCKTMIVFI